MVRPFLGSGWCQVHILVIPAISHPFCAQSWANGFISLSGYLA